MDTECRCPSATYEISVMRSTRRVGETAGPPRFLGERMERLQPSTLRVGETFTVRHEWGCGCDHLADVTYRVTRNEVNAYDAYEFAAELVAEKPVKSPDGPCGVAAGPCGQCVRMFG